MQEEIFIPITMFAAIGIVLYQFIKSRHSERMAIIEKGVNDEQLSYLLKTKKGPASRNGWSLKLGAVLVGVGLAVIIGSIVPHDMQEEITTGLIFMLPGVGLLLVYKYSDIQINNEEN